VELYLDTNIYMAFSNMDEEWYCQAQQLLTDIVSCKHSILFSDLVERELEKKSREKKVNYRKHLDQLSKIPNKTRKLEIRENTRKIAKDIHIHHPDCVHLAICKENGVVLVCFDYDAVEEAKENGITALHFTELWTI